MSHGCLDQGPKRCVQFKVIAFGAAVQAFHTVRKSTGNILLDVIPLSLGIETVGGAVQKIIERNTSIPFEKTVDFTTFEDFGEFGSSNYKFTIVDGKFATAENFDPKNAGLTVIRYGSITDEDRAVVKTAVDEYQAKD